MNEDRPALSATELLCTENTFQRCIDYVAIAGRSLVRGDLVSCVLYTEWSKKWYPSFNFAITYVNGHRF